MQERKSDRLLKLGSPTFHYKSWIFSLAGQIGVGLIVIAAIAGLFGNGILSDVNRQSGDGAVNVTYSKFTRYQSPSTIRVDLDNDVASDGIATVHLSRSLTDHYELSSISPEPESVAVRGDALTYSFNVPSANDQVTATFYVSSQRVGRISGDISAGNGGTVHMAQIVFP